MAVWFWYFLIYSFLGFLLEVGFAQLTGNPKRDRKCYLLLPLCPMYGVGALFILALPEGIRGTPWLFPVGALAATAAEYLLGLFYDKVGAVFWDYSHLPWNIGGKVCLMFTGFWGLLAVLLVHGLHPYVAAWVAPLPGWLTIPWVLAVAADSIATVALLTRYHSTDALLWYRR